MRRYAIYNYIRKNYEDFPNFARRPIAEVMAALPAQAARTATRVGLRLLLQQVHFGPSPKPPRTPEAAYTAFAYHLNASHRGGPRLRVWDDLYRGEHSTWRQVMFIYEYWHKK